ncbi:MAG: hypothetical protein LBP38_04190 [Desulfovibrio sp.]|nr:hypothetical protein [Desulfovibrio sp.]
MPRAHAGTDKSSRLSAGRCGTAGRYARRFRKAASAPRIPLPFHGLSEGRGAFLYFFPHAAT